MRNVLKRRFVFLSFFCAILVFELWSILYSTFIVHSELRQIQKKKIMLGRFRPHIPSVFVGGLAPRTTHRGLRSQAPDSFGLNPQPHWLASESVAQKSL